MAENSKNQSKKNVVSEAVVLQNLTKKNLVMWLVGIGFYMVNEIFFICKKLGTIRTIPRFKPFNNARR